MQDYNSYDLFVKNPRIHTNFPFLALDCNNKKTIPPRLRFQEMHWHEDMQITYVLEGIIKIISLGKTIEVHQGEAVFISKRVLHQFIEVETAHYRSFLFPESFINFYEKSPMEKEIEQMIFIKKATVKLKNRFYSCFFAIKLASGEWQVTSGK